MSGAGDLVVRDLRAAYGKTTILSGASATFPGGKVSALIGANGSGKSTLLRAVAGLLPASGAVRLGDTESSPAERRQGFAYMPQDVSGISSLTLMEVVLLGRVTRLGFQVPQHFIAEAEGLLARFGLSDLGTRALSAVSGGQRQLAFLAQSLFRRPAVLLLDEPTAALALRHQLIVLQALQDLAATEGLPVVVAMHDLPLVARFAHHVVGLAGGTTIAGDDARTVLTAENLAQLYGVAAEVSELDNGHLYITPLHALGSA